jgi:hypothetical protein
MLGDGCLFKFSDNAFPVLSVVRQRGDVGYLDDRYQEFKSFCLSGIRLYEVFDDRTNKTYEGCKFTTRGCSVFTPFYDAWYGGGTKTVPREVRLSPFVCSIWFCDDGCVFADDRKRLHLKLATHGFPNEDTVWLAKRLSSKLGEHFYVGHDQGHAFIMASDAATKSFIGYIQDIIPSSMARKITWTDEHFLMARSRPQLKNRRVEDLNDKEFSLMSFLSRCKLPQSSLEMCTKVGWMGKTGRTPSAYNRYLKRFLSAGWMKPTKLVIHGKSNTKYMITNKGRGVLREAVSFNTKNAKE